MKIALVSPRYWPYRGGVERYVDEIASRLIRQMEVEVLTTDPHGGLAAYELIHGVPVRRFRSWAPNDNIYGSIDLFRYLWRHSNQYHIVHANSYHALPAYYAAESKRRNKYVFTPHFHGAKGHSNLANFLHASYRFLGKKIFDRADRVIYSSLFERKKILEAFQVPDFKLVRIVEGITAIPLGSRFESEGMKTILCVCRLEKYKGVQYVLRALPRLPSFKMIVVGSGPYAGHLHHLAQSLSLEGRVEFRDNVTEEALARIYAQTDVAVLLSEHEAYSLFIGEALSSGIPCVVANRDALSEWVDGKTCVGLDDPTDSDAVAEIILRATGRRISRHLPTWADYVVRLIDVYNLCLSAQ